MSLGLFVWHQTADLLVLIMSIKLVTSLFVAALTFTFLKCCKNPSAAGASFVILIVVLSLQQAISTYLAIQFVAISIRETKVFWSVELGSSIWTILNFIGVLIFQSERGKHLREIEGLSDIKAIEMRVLQHKQIIQKSRQKQIK